MNTPKVSVIIPVYNTGDYIGQTLQSIRSQTLKEIEIIIVNDGSTDNSGEIIAEQASQDDRIQIYIQPNQGQSAARNNGINKAQGKYLYFMDSDDLLEPDALEICYKKCEEQNLDFVFFDADILNPQNSFALTLSYHRTQLVSSGKIYTGTEMLNLQLDKKGYSASPCLSFINKDYFNRAGLSFYPGIIHEDELFTAQLYLQAQRVGCVARAFFKRRLRDDSTMTRRFAWRNMNGYLTVSKELTAFYRDKNLEIQTTTRKFLKIMLNAAVYIAHALPLKERIRLLKICLIRYPRYITLKTYLVLMLKS